MPLLLVNAASPNSDCEDAVPELILRRIRNDAKCGVGGKDDLPWATGEGEG